MFRPCLALLPVLLAVWLAGCRTDQPIAPTASSAFRSEKLAEIDAAIRASIGEGQTPGGVLWLERRGAAYHKAYGDRAVEPVREPITEDTIFDAASLTKVIATTTAVMKLVEQGRIDVEAPVRRYLPEFAANGKDAVTVRQLLTHVSGLPPGISLQKEWTGRAVAIAHACAEKLVEPPGTKSRYSDINFILLGEIVRRVAGEPLDRFCAREVFGPLGMKDTGFRPFDPAAALAFTAPGSGRIAPTEHRAEGVLRGVVHDPTSRRMGGVAGHAGLFTTAGDLARFSRMMLGGGALDGRRVLRPETVKLMTSVQSPPGLARRGFGWDIDSPYAGPRGAHFPIGSFGHTGWTGTSLWIDPFSGTFVVFVANRNHPTEAGNVIGLRRKLGTLAAEAVRGFDFTHVAGALPSDPASSR